MVDVESFWKKYTPGEVVTEPAYASAGTEVYDKTADVQMIIRNKRGRDMRMLCRERQKHRLQYLQKWRIIDLKKSMRKMFYVTVITKLWSD